MTMSGSRFHTNNVTDRIKTRDRLREKSIGSLCRTGHGHRLSREARWEEAGNFLKLLTAWRFSLSRENEKVNPNQSFLIFVTNTISIPNYHDKTGNKEYQGQQLSLSQRGAQS
jgi:hypothetical protein